MNEASPGHSPSTPGKMNTSGRGSAASVGTGVIVARKAAMSLARMSARRAEGGMRRPRRSSRRAWSRISPRESPPASAQETAEAAARLPRMPRQAVPTASAGLTSGRVVSPFRSPPRGPVVA